MKKIFFVILLLNTIVSFAEKKTIYIQYYPNTQTEYDCFFTCNGQDIIHDCNCCYCLLCCFKWNKTKSNNLQHNCVIEIEEQEGSELDLKSKIELKLLEDEVFSAKYGQLHFYVDGKEIKDRNFDLNELNVVVVRQK